MKLSKSQKYANELLNSLGWKQPGDLSLEEIVWSSGAYIKYSDMNKCEGRILMNKSNAIITISSKIKFQPKINFTIAHEIGHLIMHRGISYLFSDTKQTLQQWLANGTHEMEANEFASELLMPSQLFKEKIKGKKLNLDLIKDTANYFGTSQTATFLKYKDIGDYPISIIYLENCKVVWKQESDDFPLKFIPKGFRAPEQSNCGDFFKGLPIEDEPTLIDALEWFPEDFEIEDYLQLELYEQCYKVSDNSILCCLWTK
ncbi:ImmA/IrrE family metallo-endopeptidase [Flavobacterium sp. MC2016-06]|jgi:Zn-dependent peptidase ImmA (M78 family)|uniref:ImmA/IrrE family metallo-endopeptidase n=1 Tax=Flavobacterium sp. MC2016-06 TaxID=2676308 RepID=UPI0012BAEED9|nr:ImmA/IrrE family metallo-endopeptidase [Flavobacterium sp. MC2016-06]MBU3861720.1 ImmA/IrrE family metallo-endopeptidase [Flavobacterium sp. MC2016-06]